MKPGIIKTAQLTSHQAVILPDGTRVVLAQVQTYRVPNTKEPEIAFTTGDHRVIVAGFGDLKERDAVLGRLDEIFGAKKL